MSEKKCPKCGIVGAGSFPWRFKCGSLDATPLTPIQAEKLHGADPVSFDCLTRQRDALERRVRELVRAGDMMHKYCDVNGPESLLSKLEWVDTKAKGPQ